MQKILYTSLCKKNKYSVDNLKERKGKHRIGDLKEIYKIH